MPKKRKSDKRKVTKEERVKPTLETLQKLTPDPLFEIILGMKEDDRAPAQDAVSEIMAIHKWLFSSLGIRPYGVDRIDPSPHDIPAWVADAYKERYLPWIIRNKSSNVSETVHLIWDRTISPLNPQDIALCLQDY